VDTQRLDQSSGKLYVVGGGDWPSQSAQVLEYDVTSDTWRLGFPDLITARRDHAGVYASVCTPDPDDGLPGMWVFGGRVSGESDEPPYGNPEFFSFTCPLPEPPEASFTALPAPGYTPLTIQFTDVSSGAVLERLWDFGDQTGTSNGWRPIHTYDTAGEFEVTLWVTNTSGSDFVTKTINVDGVYRMYLMPIFTDAPSP
jgi:PKD repeat protein